MALLELEGMLFNTDDIVVVRKSIDPDFPTELVLVSGGTQLLKTPVFEVIKLIKSAK
jgi:hypothetical protein